MHARSRHREMPRAPSPLLVDAAGNVVDFDASHQPPTPKARRHTDRNAAHLFSQPLSSHHPVLTGNWRSAHQHKSTKSSVHELSYWRERAEKDNMPQEFDLYGNEHKLQLKVFRANRLPANITITNKMKVLSLINVMAERESIPLNLRMTIVEKIPAMKLERVLEDHWSVYDSLYKDCKPGTYELHFEERDDTFGMFENARKWLNPSLANYHNDKISDSRSKEIFESGDNSNDVKMPEYQDYLYIRSRKGQWKRRFCTIRASGIYASKRKSYQMSDFVRIAAFTPSLFLYTSTGRWSDLQAPTSYGFVLKPLQSLNYSADMTLAFCAQDEIGLDAWYSFVRIFMIGKVLWDCYLDRIKLCEERKTPLYDRPNRRDLWSNRSKRKYQNTLQVPNGGTGSHGNLGHNNTIATTITTASAFASNNSATTASTGNLTSQNTIISNRRRHDYLDYTKSLGNLHDLSEFQGEITNPIRRSRSASSWTSLRSNSLSRSISSVFSNIIEQGQKAINPVKKKLTGRGPSARRCSRSVKSISSPFAVTSSNPALNSYLSRSMERPVSSTLDMSDAYTLPATPREMDTSEPISSDIVDHNYADAFNGGSSSKSSASNIETTNKLHTVTSLDQSELSKTDQILDNALGNLQIIETNIEDAPRVVQKKPLAPTKFENRFVHDL